MCNVLYFFFFFFLVMIEFKPMTSVHDSCSYLLVSLYKLPLRIDVYFFNNVKRGVVIFATPLEPSYRCCGPHLGNNRMYHYLNPQFPALHM